jgi:hypothetical protein
MSAKKEDGLVTRLSAMMKNMPELHNLEFEIGFNLHSNTFFRKLIPTELLGEENGVRVESEGFYRGLVFLDYFCSVVQDNYKARDNLIIISKKLRELEKELGVSKELSYLSLDSIAGEASLCAKEKGEGHYSDAAVLKGIKERYKAINGDVDFTSDKARKADPYFTAIGTMAYDLVKDKRRDHLNYVNGRADLGALVFTDCMVELMKDKKQVDEVEEALNKHDYLGASMLALQSVVKSISKEDVYLKIELHFNERLDQK